MDDFLKGVTGFFTARNIGGLLMLFFVATALAYFRLTPDRVASMIPRPGEITDLAA